MCDELTEHSNEQAFTAGARSRRGFGVMSAAALAACAASPENPVTIAEREVTITSPDGVIDAHYAAPSGGRHPAVLVWPDIMGLRPAFRRMGVRLAESGYAVLTVNPFYRSQAGEVIKEGESFSQPEVRSRLIPLMQAATGNPDNTRKDAIAAIGWLDQQKEVDTRRGVGCIFVRALGSGAESSVCSSSTGDNGALSGGSRPRGDIVYRGVFA
jgi:carboxymethylenebutenolidase